MILGKALSTVELDTEALYNATVTGSDMLVRIILRNKPQLKDILCTPELLKAAEESQQTKMADGMVGSVCSLIELCGFMRTIPEQDGTFSCCQVCSRPRRKR